MYTQHSRLNAANNTFVPIENGPTVKLLQQTGNHKVIFVDAAGVESSVPSWEFFGSFGDATQAAIAEFEKATAKPAPMLTTRAPKAAPVTDDNTGDLETAGDPAPARSTRGANS